MGQGWQFMQDGIVFAEFNHQGGRRGGNEFVVPNWWMGMATRSTSHGRLTFTSMLSLDPATVGKDGYREIFQAGEALNGRLLIDRQHPHDLFMQLAAVWRTPVNDSTGFTLAGGPVGEPALGPVAFMHRASAADNPTAPLSHHTFDSTHIAFDVVTAAVDHGPFVIEASVFNGREPDENRWDFDFGRLDSFSGRIWYRPNDEWELQASSGRLVAPEQLEPGNIVRSTASVSWTRKNGAAISSVTAGYGRNDTDHGARNAFFIEGSRHAARVVCSGTSITTRSPTLMSARCAILPACLNVVLSLNVSVVVFLAVVCMVIVCAEMAVTTPRLSLGGSTQCTTDGQTTGGVTLAAACSGTSPVASTTFRSGPLRNGCRTYSDRRC
jgi:hypothetical protein